MVWLIKPRPLDPLNGVVPRAKDQRATVGAVGMFSRAGRPLKPIMIYDKDQVASVPVGLCPLCRSVSHLIPCNTARV